MFRQHDPGFVLVVWKGIEFKGFMDGTYVSAERDTDAYTKAVGATGDAARVRSRNRGGKVTLTLQQTSPTNDLLTAQQKIDEISNAATGSLTVKDLLGTTLIFAEVAWIMKSAKVDFGTELQGREWVFDCAELDMGVGGALV